MSALQTFASSSPSPTANRYAINANWLMKLRWVAVIGQLSTIAVVAMVLRISVQLSPLLVALTVTTSTNVVFTLWLRSLPTANGESLTPNSWHRVFMSLMVLDLVVLSLLLYFTGGHANPFSLFYFVNLTLSGILLPPARAWLLNLLSVVCFSTLFYYQIPLEPLQQSESLKSIREIGTSTLGHRGLLIAFAACSSVIVYFVTRLNAELRDRDKALRESQMREARSDKWEALGTLSAGAAHELATPLTTIAIVSKELERELKNRDLPASIVGDVDVIRREVDRCRAILDRMSIDAGHATAEPNSIVDAERLIEATLDEMLESRRRVTVAFANSAKACSVKVPLQSVCQALRGVVQNALDASERDVELNVAVDDNFLQIAIVDHGTGMTNEVLQRADEPFFTTKETGKGMGLGRFLARTVFERVGGSFRTDSSVGIGTRVTIELPSLEVTT